MSNLKNLTKEQKNNTKIMLYELLNEYEEELKPDRKEYADCKDKQELASQMLLSDLLKSINLIKNVLVYDF